MSIRNSIWISCDGMPGVECDEEIVLYGEDATVANLRAAAAAAGWATDVQGLDNCPAHKQER